MVTLNAYSLVALLISSILYQISLHYSINNEHSNRDLMRCFGALLSTTEIVYLAECSMFCLFRQLAQRWSHKSRRNHGFLSVLNWTSIY